MALKIDLEINGMRSNLEGATYLVLKLASGEWSLLESGVVDILINTEFTIPLSSSGINEFDEVMVVVTDCNGNNYSTAGTATDFIRVSEVYKDFSVVPLQDFFVQCENRTLAYTPWDMGDGSILTEEDPFYMYRDNGTFTISNDDFSQDVVITGVTKFSVILEGNTITCVKQSGTEGAWDFGNGDGDINDNTEYVYYENGIYTVTYGGFTETITVDYYTDMVDRIEGNIVYFNRPIGADGLISTGDGMTEVVDSHEYAIHGRYIVAVDGYFDVVVLGGAVLPNYSFYTSTDPDDTGIWTFTALGQASAYKYTIGDFVSTTNPLVFDFNTLGGGEYKVELVGRASNGNSGSYERVVTVLLENTAPIIYGVSVETDQLAATFSIDDDVITSGEEYSYLWVGSNGQTSTDKEGVITSFESETYTVYCKVTDNRSPALSTISETLEVTVSDAQSEGPNILLENNANLANMDSDVNGLINRFRYLDPTFSNGEAKVTYSSTGSLGRIMIFTETLGLELGEKYIFTLRIKSSDNGTSLKLE